MRALFLIVPNGFRDEEYSVPKKMFEAKGIAVITGSTVLGQLTGKRKLTTATVDVLLQTAVAKDYDCLVIVGGQDTFWYNEKIITLLRELQAAHKPIGAICLSGVLPAQAGLMQDQRATAFETPESVADLKKNGAIYTGEAVTVSGNIVTANGAEAAAQFADELLKLCGY
jgi:protease I